MGSPDAAGKLEKAAAETVDRRDPWIEATGVESPSAAGEILESFRAYLLLVANREIDPRLRGKVAPSDVVQNTFINAQEKLPGFRGTTKEELQAWLRRILLNNLADVRRRFVDAEKRSVAREQSFDGDSRAPVPAKHIETGALSPPAAMIAREESEVMRQALNRLSDDHRAAECVNDFETTF